MAHLSALNDAGGWKDRATVEGMDLAVWRFVFLGDLMVKCVSGSARMLHLLRIRFRCSCSYDHTVKLTQKG